MVGVDGKKYPVINEKILQRTSNHTAIPEQEIEGYLNYFCEHIKNVVVPEYGTVQLPYMGNLKPQYKKIRYMKWLAVVAATNGHLPRAGTAEREIAFQTIMNKNNGTKTTNNGGRLEDQDS